MTQPSAGRLVDPFIQGKFWVEINGIAVAAFTECTGLSVQTEMDTFKEGGYNSGMRQLVKTTKWNNIVLKRGWIATDELWNWYLKIIEGKLETKPVSILAYPNRGSSTTDSRFSWDLEKAFPVKWTGPDFRADGNGVAVETLELAHSGWRINKAAR